jgi:PAS domain S-box-containing protein
VVAVLAVALTLGIKLLLGPKIGSETPFLLFFAAVMFSAWYGGMGAGLLTTALSAIAADYFFLPPLNSLTLDAKGLLQVGVFALEGMAVSAVVSSLHAARRRAEASTKEAERHQATLRQSQEDFRLLVENVSDYAIFMVNTEGRVESWGLGAESIFGYKDAEIIGRPSSLLFTPEDVESGVPEDEMKRAEAKGRAEDERWHIRRDGSRFWASGIMTALRDETGRLRGFSKVARDLTERKQVQEALGASEERYRIVAEAATDAIITIDRESRILYVNQAAEKIFGHRIAEMQGASLTMLMPDYLRHLHRAGIERYIQTGQRHVSWESVEVPGLHKNGHEVALEISFGEFKREGTRYFTGICRDISERKRVQSRLATQHAVTRIIADAHDVAEATPKIIQAVCESLGWEVGELWRVHTDENSLRCTEAWHAPSVGDEIYADMCSEHPLHAGIGLPGRVWSSGDPIWISDVTREPDFPRARAAARAGLRSAFAFPIMLGAKIVGVMEFFSRDVRERDESIIEMISTLGSQIGQFLERRRVERERAELLAREQEAREEAEVANRLKDEFLATLSHELRTPLTAILGWSRMLSAGQLDADNSQRALETIERNAKTQAQLIEDILDVSRIITGKLRLDVRPVSLSSIIEAAVDTAVPAAEAKGIRLQRVIDSSPATVSGDPGRLQQVVWNLVSNAIKFTSKGGRVLVRLERVNSHVEIVVSDTGKGIRPELLPYVFDRFRQADSSSTRAHAGLGLGLAIVRHLVELHGGTVQAESGGEGQGATFTVNLPLMPMRVPQVPSRREEERTHPTASDGIGFDCPPELSGLHVLVVDDEEDARSLVSTVLEKCGARVTAVGSAAEALVEFERALPDVLLSDIGMPEEDGYSLITKVRSLPAGRGGQTPAAALTAYARVEDRMRVLRAGFQTHVPKPVEPAELVTIVANLAGRFSKVRPTGELQG